MANHCTVLIIDDAVENIHSISKLLGNQYQILTATSAEAGLLIASKQPNPMVILLAENMLDTDGCAVLTRLHENFATIDIPILLLTAYNSELVSEQASRLGVADCISKPIQPTELIAKIHTQILAQQVQVLVESNLIQQTTIRALAHLAELSDPKTSNHILRTSGYVRHLAYCLQQHPRFVDYFTEQVIDLLGQSAPLHDIGKIAISDDILLKPGKLKPEEWTVMKSHTVFGSQAIAKAMHGIRPPLRLLALAKEIAHWHHEKWDGSGYPDGLAGDAIPVSARLMALADVFDALINARVYKPAMSNAEAREIIIAGRGKHFDPDMTDAFIKHFGDFVAIARKYQDVA